MNTLETVNATELQRIKSENETLRWENRVMRNALIEICGFSLLDLDASYSSKQIATRALRRVD